jgi:hypothetical protein
MTAATLFPSVLGAHAVGCVVGFVHFQVDVASADNSPNSTSKALGLALTIDEKRAEMSHL